MKYILRITLFGIIFILLVHLTTGFLIPGTNVTKYGILKSGNYSILSEKQDKIDVIFLGDSLIYSSISPMEIWNNHGYTSFDGIYSSDSARAIQTARIVASEYDMNPDNVKLHSGMREYNYGSFEGGSNKKMYKLIIHLF